PIRACSALCRRGPGGMNRNTHRWHDTNERRAMTPSRPPDSSRPGLLEEVLGEYMQCLDRGEAVDREQLLARHPELAEELRSYFAGSDEVDRLRQQAGGGPPTDLLSRARTGPGPAEPGPSAEGRVRRVGY